MAPRTPRITTGFDQSYACSTCDTENLDFDQDLNERDWTCSACGHPVLIALADDAGNTALVVRYQAQHLEPGDYIYQEHDLDGGVLRVMGSNKAMGKGNKWYLGLQGFGSMTVEPDRYFNRVP
ncbi:hypothetical protein [Pseudomonas sp. Fl4BN1]|uniref:hypothetical protein n=1 Tax=Pseudomonas sp. Fl4BN1 TaxID=2697651 RepID=UPI0013768B43|nr:hypothetical protein [Pseudomonas sp. Fl4BN1]NBF11441.1 hypothetical protein [Pseudomonas sp. Fl4BN1]